MADMSEHETPSEPTIKQYRQRYETYSSLPTSGLPRDEVLKQMREMHEQEQERWGDGYASGAVYNGDPEHIAFLNEAYAINSQANPLHTDLWPSAVKYESEVVAMTGTMLGGGDIGGGPGSADGVCGTVSSGGSESIQLAMKTYRDHARATKGITKPQMVVPVSAHAAFDKSAEYFGIEIVHVPVGDDWRADPAAMADAITDDTVVMVGSAPPFPHGIIDPIEELSEIARERGIGFHTDGCLGGFVLPFAEKLGYPVPPFDFRLPGVTSMSADTHKFGYAAKGTSVVLYRDQDLRHYQYFTMTDWPGGLYCSPSFAGSRPGALERRRWAAMVSIGEEGYLDSVRRILETADTIKTGLATIDDVRTFGDPLFVIAVPNAGSRCVPRQRCDDHAWVGAQPAAQAGSSASVRHTSPHAARGGRAFPRRSARVDRMGEGQPVGRGWDGAHLRHGQHRSRAWSGQRRHARPHGQLVPLGLTQNQAETNRTEGAGAFARSVFALSRRSSSTPLREGCGASLS